MKPHRTLAALLAWALALAPASADIFPPAGTGAVPTGATNFQSLADYMAGMPVNAKALGADCASNASVTSAVESAVGKGFHSLLLPAGCTYIPTADITPADLEIIGQDFTSIITVANPAATSLKVGPRGGVKNVGVIDFACTTNIPPTSTPKTCPVRDAQNASDSAYGFQWWPLELQVRHGATLTYPDGTVSTTDKPGIASIVEGTGADAFYAGALASAATGIRLVPGASGAIGAFILNGSGDATPSNPHTGIWLKEFGTGGQNASNSSFYLDRASAGGAPVGITLKDADSTGNNTADWFDVTTTHQTSGNIFNVFHSTSAYSGNVLQANLASGGGSFTGSFLLFQKNNVTQFQVDNAGALNAISISQNGVRVAATNTAQASPGNPTGTTSTAGLMMGLAGAITPATTGKILILISGDIANSTSGDGAKVQIRTGTGTAPVNAAALTGTTCGGLVQDSAASAAGAKVPFSLNCIVTGLTLNTAIWIDVGLAAITAGTASIADVSVSAHEL